MASTIRDLEIRQDSFYRIELNRLLAGSARGVSLDSSLSMLKPAQLLLEHMKLFLEERLPGPVLDLACGDGRNGIFLAREQLEVICCDRSAEALEQAKKLATSNGIPLKRDSIARCGVAPPMITLQIRFLGKVLEKIYT